MANSCLWTKPDKVEWPKVLATSTSEQSKEEIARTLKGLLESPPEKTLNITIKLKWFPIWQVLEQKRKRMNSKLWEIRQIIHDNWGKITATDNYLGQFTLQCKAAWLFNMIKSQKIAMRWVID